MIGPDDVLVALEVMDERWPGYLTAKQVIRGEIVALRMANIKMKNSLKHGHTDNDGVICDEGGRHECDSCIVLEVKP